MKKKRILQTVLILLACALIAVTTTVVAKYIIEREKELQVGTGEFYFRSNVLKAPSENASYEVLGSKTVFNLSNFADSKTVSDRDISYTVTKSVKIDGVWTAVGEPITDAFTANTAKTSGIEVEPVVLNGVSYYDVLVTAKAQSPFTKTLQCEFNFVYVPYTLDYSYEELSGTITLRIITNSDSGNFVIGWAEGVLPDNADPNKILTDAKAGKSSVTAALDALTVYELNFFVDSDVREFVDEQLAAFGSPGTSAYEQGLRMLLEENITCVMAS